MILYRCTEKHFTRFKNLLRKFFLNEHSQDAWATKINATLYIIYFIKIHKCVMQTSTSSTDTLIDMVLKFIRRNRFMFPHLEGYPSGLSLVDVHFCVARVARSRYVYFDSRSVLWSVAPREHDYVIGEAFWRDKKIKYRFQGFRLSILLTLE